MTQHTVTRVAVSYQDNLVLQTATHGPKYQETGWEDCDLSRSAYKKLNRKNKTDGNNTVKL